MFCKICGNELNEKAVICPKCGCAVENAKLPKIKKPINSPKFMVICKYASIVLLCFTFMFMMVSIIDPYVYAYDFLYLTSGDIYGSIIVSWRPARGTAIACVIFSVLSYVISAIGFAFSFKKENKVKRFVFDVIFIIANFVLLVSIVLVSYSSSY